MKTVTVDDCHRVCLPDAKPGQVLALEEQADGFKLTFVRKAEPKTVKLKLVERAGRLVADTTGLTIDPDDIGRAVREERDAQGERGVRP